MSPATFLSQLFARPWIWAWLGAVAVWLATAAFTQGQGASEVLRAALTFGTFFVVVGIGQMFVITTGPGNIDLSVPATIALSGAVSMQVMGGQNALIAVGLAAALGVGLGVGLFNYALIRLLRIPPIIATLSAAFLVQSTAIAYGRGLRVRPPQAFADFTTGSLFGVPLLALCIGGLAVVMGVVLHRTLYGRAVLAIGQNQRAARLAGLPVERVRCATYVLCAVFAGLNGALLAGFSGGSSLNMGEEFLLGSIAVVVIGGTSVAGGNGNLPGLWGAALFLFLLQSMLNTYQLSAGLRYLATGLIIITVITAAGGQKTLR